MSPKGISENPKQTMCNADRRAEPWPRIDHAHFRPRRRPRRRPRKGISYEHLERPKIAARSDA